MTRGIFISELTILFIFRYKRILVIISHSQDFLNGVCTNIVHMDKNRLKYYTVSVIGDRCRLLSVHQ